MLVKLYFVQCLVDSTLAEVQLLTAHLCFGMIQVMHGMLEQRQEVGGAEGNRRLTQQHSTMTWPVLKAIRQQVIMAFTYVVISN